MLTQLYSEYDITILYISYFIRNTRGSYSLYIHSPEVPEVIEAIDPIQAAEAVDYQLSCE